MGGGMVVRVYEHSVSLAIQAATQNNIPWVKKKGKERSVRWVGGWIDGGRGLICTDKKATKRRRGGGGGEAMTKKNFLIECHATVC